jgi:DNA polymerase-3 subunit delta'
MAKRSTAERAEEEWDVPERHPKRTDHLIAHEEAEKQLLTMINAKRLPHALLITGPRGVGKATLAYRLARFLLAPPEAGAGSLFGDALPPESLYIASSHPTFGRVLAGTHPDLLVLEAEDIKVEDARSVSNFLSLTPAESEWRVVVIDSADAMNRSAANALLKTLEEPPARAVLLLVSHNPGSLLPTIRSRCRTLRMHPLDEVNFARIMGQIAPQLSPQECHSLALLSGYSPGVALPLIESKAETLYRELLERISIPDTLKLYEFADRFARKDSDKQWQLFSRLMLWLLARIATVGAGSGAEVFAGEGQVLERLKASKPLDLWTELWEKARRLLADTEHLHLDRKQAVITLLRAAGE